MLITPSRDETLKAFARQYRQVVTTDPSMVTCECGHTIRLRSAYRCLYCGLWFCTKCAEGHFGKTREEYLKEVQDEADKTIAQNSNGN